MKMSNLVHCDAKHGCILLGKIWSFRPKIGNEAKTKHYGKVFLKMYSIADKNIFDCKNSLSSKIQCLLIFMGKHTTFIEGT